MMDYGQNNIQVAKKLGRPRKFPKVPSRTLLRRKERIAKFVNIVTSADSLPKYSEMVRHPTQTICVTLSLPCLVLLDLYLEYTAQFSLLATHIHHGVVLDSLTEQLREDKGFIDWLSANYKEK